MEGIAPPKYQENPSVRFGGATARSPDEWATRFGPYGRERPSVDGASVSTRQRQGGHQKHHRHGSVVRLP